MRPFILLVGPSGTGKTTIAEELEKEYGMKSIQSYTTRPPRYPGETGHTFIDDEGFDQLENMVGYTVFNGYRYCATEHQVATHDIYVIDPVGVEYFKQHYKGNREWRVYYLSAPDIIRERRMRKRGDSIEKVKARLENDKEAFDPWLHSIDIYAVIPTHLYSPKEAAELIFENVNQVSVFERGTHHAPITF